MSKGEPKPKITIPTRTARAKGGMFNNLRKPEEIESISIEELVAPVQPPTPVATPVTTPVPTPVTIPVEATERQPMQYLDATHTASEAQVYSVMYRETVSRNLRERHFGPTELMKKTGIRSDRTIRRAIDGLLAKLSVEITAYAEGSPLGPRYRVYKPKEIEQRRKEAGLEIDQFTKRIVTPVATPVTTPVATGDKNYRGTGVDITPVTGVEIAGVYKYRNDPLASQAAAGSSSNDRGADDDTALAALSATERELTGKVSSPDAWLPLFELLTTELKIAAARTGTVSNVPAFLTEHLRRRLFKRSKEEMQGQSRQASQTQAGEAVEANQCPDCGGSGWWYPEGTDKGVARCKHARLSKPQPQPD